MCGSANWPSFQDPGVKMIGRHDRRPAGCGQPAHQHYSFLSFFCKSRIESITVHPKIKNRPDLLLSSSTNFLFQDKANKSQLCTKTQTRASLLWCFRQQVVASVKNVGFTLRFQVDGRNSSIAIFSEPSQLLFI